MSTNRPRAVPHPERRERVQLPAGPIAVTSLRGVNRLKSGHVWIYRSDIVSTKDAGPGSVVAVADERGRFFGSALYSSSSQIALRMISTAPVTDFPTLLRERVRNALT